jgi:hypothetical protein
MGFFVEPNQTVTKLISDPDEWAKRDPSVTDTMLALSELRAAGNADVLPGDSWKHVASVRGPILDIATCLDQDFMRDKKKFYAWLDSEEGRRWCTYDRRRGANSSRWFRMDGGMNNGTQEPGGSSGG